MRVIGYDPFVSADQAAKMGMEYVEQVRAMLPKVDYLTVHTPLTPETKDLIGFPELELLKPGIRLINAARGGIYNEAALMEGLKSGKIGGVALDVFEHEPCTDSPLFKMKNVLCTPHLGASTEEAQNQVAIEAVELLVNYFSTGEVRHAVNMAAVDPATLRSLKGYIDLAYRLGRLLAQWHSGGASGCKLHYRGDVATKNTKLLTSSFCAGLLEGALDEEVNIVNAEMLLRERGVRVSEELQAEPGAFSSSIAAEVQTDGTAFSVAGTLFGNNMPRLIRIGEFRLETYLDGNLMIFLHDDVPGIIGSVGTILGRHRVNIAQMSVGRAGKTAGGPAIGVLQTDEIPSSAAIDEVLQHKNIQSIRIIRLPAAGAVPPWLEA
jgi:D-3-phosphoglycerate dehydrogenase